MVLASRLPEVQSVLCDVTEFDRIDDIVEQVEDAHGPVDVLINNAGYGHEGILESPLEEMRRQFDVNVFGAVAVAKAFLPRFRERRSGFIVNVTSMGGMITMPGIAYYCGSKFAFQGISEVMRAEMPIRRACDDALSRLFPNGLGWTLDGPNRALNPGL